MNKLRNTLWGLAFIAVGGIIALNALGITDIDLLFPGWWAILFIILPCFIDLFKNESKTGNIIGILIGAVLFLCCQGILDFSIFGKLLIPAILIAIGISFIFKDLFGKKISQKIKEITASSNSEKVEFCSTFSGQKIDFTNQVIENCTLTAIFGAIDADFRNAIITEDKVITVSAIFGGIEILLPDNVNVKIKSTSIFGGIDSKKHDHIENAHTIYIDGSCIFGGTSIK